LASRAGLRAGAGLVTLLSPPDAVAVNASHLTAVMLKEVSDAEQLRESIESASTVILGPAAGITTGTKKN
ncbi:MAG TPA: NAD(P)H-hydrate dehydratase, partial [Hyphomonas sp.]|nr:NAD(P)H-hydrate dehydratase [Hyphomonas sp.]